MTNNINNDDENLHIGELFKRIFSYWKIYVPIGIVCLICAFVFLLVTPKEYKNLSRMQLLNENQGMMSELKMLKGSGFGGLLGGSGTGVNVDDEIALMISRQNLIPVIKENNLQLEITKRRGLKNVLIDTDELPIKLFFPPLFLDTLSRPIMVSFELNNGEIIKMKWKSSLFSTVSYDNQVLPMILKLPIGDIALSKNLPLSGAYKIRISPLQLTYETLLSELDIEAANNMSDIVELVHESSSKSRSSKLLNGMMNQYNEYSKEVKTKDANLNAEFVAIKLDTIAMELALLEHRIENYKQTNKMPNPETYASITIYGNKEVEQVILEKETRINMLDYLIKYVDDPANEYAAIPVINGFGDGIISSYNELLLNRQRLLISSETNNPALILVESQLREYRKMLLESIKGTNSNIQIELDVLYRKDIQLAREIDKLPQQEREFIEMKRQQRIKESIYLFLMQKLQEKELVNSPEDMAGRIIDKAYSSYKHVFPKGTIVLIIAFFIACTLSLIGILIKYIISKNKS